MIRIKEDTTSKELHERNYSIYDSKEEEIAALKELHNRSYMILNEEDTINLLVEYEEEYDRLSRGLSFFSLQHALKNQDLFKEAVVKPGPKKARQSVKTELANVIASLILYKAKHKKTVQLSISDDTFTGERFFFIIDKDEKFGKCEVVGTYEPLTGEFILKKGSIFPFDVSSYFRYSVTDIQRRAFLARNCVKFSKGYRLRNDYVCKSPDHAAKIVRGGEVDGWSEWTDSNGRSLKEIYK